MRALKSILILAFSSLFFSNLLFAADCSRADIDHYLERGFSHDQVVRLCTNEPKLKIQANETSRQTIPEPGPAPMHKTAPEQSTDAGFFQIAIKARKVMVGNERIQYIAKECMKFGLEDMTGDRAELCREVETSIAYSGLKVVSAHQGMFLIAERELIVSGKITRTLVDTKPIPRRFRADFEEDFAASPQQVSIPVRDAVDPVELGQKLLSMGNTE